MSTCPCVAHLLSGYSLSTPPEPYKDVFVCLNECQVNSAWLCVVCLHEVANLQYMNAHIKDSSNDAQKGILKIHLSS